MSVWPWYALWRSFIPTHILVWKIACHSWNWRAYALVILATRELAAHQCLLSLVPCCCSFILSEVLTFPSLNTSAATSNTVFPLHAGIWLTQRFQRSPAGLCPHCEVVVPRRTAQVSSWTPCLAHRPENSFWRILGSLSQDGPDPS